MKKGLIALFSSLGIVGILLLLFVIGSIIGVVVWYYEKKKKEGYVGYVGWPFLAKQRGESNICRSKYGHTNDFNQCKACTLTTGVSSDTATEWCNEIARY